MPSRRAYDAATNLVAGTVSRYVVLALNIGVGVVLMPFTVRHLGRADYGLWMLVASMTAYFKLLDLGYGNGVVRHLIEADRRGDRDDVNRIASTFVCVYCVIAIAAAVGIALTVAVVVPRFPHLSPAQIRVAQIVLAIIGARVAIGFPLTVFGAITNAREGFVLNNVIASATVLASAVCTYVVLVRGGGLVALVAYTTALNVASYGAYAWNAYRTMPELRIRPGYFSVARWREVTSFSIYLFVIQLAAQVTFNVDTVVVGASLGTALVAVYAVGLRLAEYQRRLCDQFSGMLFPVVMGFGAEGDHPALQRALVDGNRIATALVAGASICLIGFGGPLIRLWMGPGFEGGVAPFIVLAVAGMVVVSQAASSNVLIACGKERLIAGIWIGEAVANLLLSVVLVRRMGLVGVAVGTLVPLVAGHLFIMLSAACRSVDVSVRTCVRETTRPALVAAPMAAAACLACRLAYVPGSITVVVAEMAGVGAVYGLALLTIGFDRNTRHAYMSQVLDVSRALWRTIGRLTNRAPVLEAEPIVPLAP